MDDGRSLMAMLADAVDDAIGNTEAQVWESRAEAFRWLYDRLLRNDGGGQRYIDGSGMLLVAEKCQEKADELRR